MNFHTQSDSFSFNLIGCVFVMLHSTEDHDTKSNLISGNLNLISHHEMKLIFLGLSQYLTDGSGGWRVRMYVKSH